MKNVEWGVLLQSLETAYVHHISGDGAVWDGNCHLYGSFRAYLQWIPGPKKLDCECRCVLIPIIVTVPDAVIAKIWSYS